ncbi:hypothetical protein SAMN05444487_11033 [Marininema mesophilum]|uniref:YdbS-like PH domain-containing protein n=1 Tax=Marininema mesophilum TaxID=1048340 RepID=A0A1H2YWP6_9BACL|nr:PH domain-containing protein [Marininema mesophilum]SDX09501.1 hypothetical protein SAMN05444487_11033 [Marininema mesophilum]
MIKEPKQQISNDAIKVWRIAETIAFISILSILLILLCLGHYYEWNRWIGYILYFFLVTSPIYSIISIVFVPIYRQKTWRYDVDEKYIQLRYGGVWEKTHLIIPMVKVQFVNTNQGPLLRKFGLSTITIGTMASEHEIPALPEKIAIELRDHIAFLAGVESDESNKREAGIEYGEG